MAKSKLPGMENRLKRHISEKVRAARRAQGLSQEELAARIARTAESVSNIERARTLPNIDTLIALSRALEVPLRDLFPAEDDYRKISARRSRLENEAYEEIKALPDQLLEIALRQIRALKSP